MYLCKIRFNNKFKAKINYRSKIDSHSTTFKIPRLTLQNQNQTYIKCCLRS